VLTRWLEQLATRLAPTLPPHRRAWAVAFVAELAAVPPGERRLRWAASALWFVVRHRVIGLGSAPAVAWASWAFAALGVLSVAPWLLFSVQGLRETDAPDATVRSMVATLAAQLVLIAAFLATFRPVPRAGLLLVISLISYAATTALAAADNHGYPLLAAVIFVAPPAMAAAPILATLGTRRRRPQS
jgi:hypothetical protein